MTYFSVRKQQTSPAEPAEQPEEAELLADEPDEDQTVDETPTTPRPTGQIIRDGLTGPSRWLTHRLGPGPSLAAHGVGLWACGFYGPVAATGIIGSWALAALAFIPREDLERAAAAIERLHTRQQPADEPDEETPGESGEPPADPIVSILWKLIDDAPGTHLKTIAEHLTQATPGEPVNRAAVRAKLGALGIPARGSVRNTHGKVNEGVHRDDLTAWEEAHSPTDPAPPSKKPETGVATPVTCGVGNDDEGVATPLLRLRKALSRGAG